MKLQRPLSVEQTNQYCPRGFTLTELLIVIAIIAILAALLLPAQAGRSSKPRQSNA